MFHAHRMHSQDPSGWHGLPQDVWNLIFKKLESSPTVLNDIASLRLVSPSWRDAVQQCPWKLQCKLRDNRTLEGFCKALPAITVLQIQRYESMSDSEASLSGMVRYERRRQVLKDSEESTADTTVEMQHLPSALQTLSLDGVYANPSTFAATDCPCLTNLCVVKSQNSDQDVADLLTYLPALRVRSLA